MSGSKVNCTSSENSSLNEEELWLIFTFASLEWRMMDVGSQLKSPNTHTLALGCRIQPGRHAFLQSREHAVKKKKMHVWRAPFLYWKQKNSGEAWFAPMILWSLQAFVEIGCSYRWIDLWFGGFKFAWQFMTPLGQWCHHQVLYTASGINDFLEFSI